MSVIITPIIILSVIIDWIFNLGSIPEVGIPQYAFRIILIIGSVIFIFDVDAL